MRISFDAGKRLSNIAKHGIDFDTAQEVFDHPSIEIPDRRFDYGEDRFRTIGHLRGRIAMVVWTADAGGRRIISMRKTNEREQKLYADRFGTP